MVEEASTRRLIYQRFSRLVYDCNRPPESPAAMPAVSEVYEIPGNASPFRCRAPGRTEALYVPFHDRIREISSRAQGWTGDGLVTMHSFTPVYHGKQRDVEIGILHDEDARLADRCWLLPGKRQLYAVRRNEPYGPEDGVTHTLKLHAWLEERVAQRNDRDPQRSRSTDEIGQKVMADYLTG
jgi:predicted N-formylglutamate amidohydrolase